MVKLFSFPFTGKKRRNKAPEVVAEVAAEAEVPAAEARNLV
jgi:hypothetical protein